MIIFFKPSIVVVGEIITSNFFFEGGSLIPIIIPHFALGWVGIYSLWLDSVGFD